MLSARRHAMSRSLANERIRQRERRDAARRIARMDAGLLDVLEHAADVHVVAVAHAVEVDLHRRLQELVQVHGMVGRDLGRLAHVAAQLLRIVHDGHAAPAEHVARAHEQREADAPGNAHGLVERVGVASGRIGDLQAVEHLGEAVAVLGQVDGIGARAHERHARFLQGARQLERRLPAQRGHDAVGPLHVDDVHDVLEGERLEIQLVGRVVVGRDRLGIAVHHDGLVARLVQRIARMHAAVVELDALPDAVGPRPQDERLGLGPARRRSSFWRNVSPPLAFSSCVVGLVVVGGRARELGSAGVDGLERGHDAERLAAGAHDDLGRVREEGDLRIREAVALGDAERLGVHVVDARSAQRLLHGDDVGHAVEEEAVDARRSCISAGVHPQRSAQPM